MRKHPSGRILFVDNKNQDTTWIDPRTGKSSDGKTEDELEEASDPIRPSLIEASFEESGSVLDKVDEVFKGIKAQYPDKQQVIDYLDFVDKPLKEQSKEQANSGGSETVTSGRGDDYVKAKLPKLKRK